MILNKNKINKRSVESIIAIPSTEPKRVPEGTAPKIDTLRFAVPLHSL
jgi:hypothetical protein